jgi:hypothetical protein
VYIRLRVRVAMEKNIAPVRNRFGRTKIRIPWM